MVRQGKIRGILVWRLDRLARNMVDGGNVIYELTEGRLEEIVTPEMTFTNTGDAKFVLALQFGMAAKFADDLSAGVKRGNEKVRRLGKVPGPVPIGYTKTHEHETGRGPGIVIPDPERFDLVKRIWREFLDGAPSVMEVWRKARYEWGLTTRPTEHTLAHPIGFTSIYQLLRNPFYAGKISHDGKLYPGEHPPMITMEEFERVQERVGRHDAPRPEVGHHHFLYAGLLHCGHCQRLLVGEQITKPSGHVYTYYRCGRRRAGYYQCHAPAPTEDQVTGEILKVLGGLEVDPALRKWALKAIEWWAGKTELTPVSMMAKAKRELAKAERERTTLTDLVLQNEISIEEYEVRRMNAQKRVEHLREALTDPMERLEAWRAAKAELERTGLNFMQMFKIGTDDEKRSLVNRVFSDIIVTKRIARPMLRMPFVLRPVPTLPAKRPTLQATAKRTLPGRAGSSVA